MERPVHDCRCQSKSLEHRVGVDVNRRDKSFKDDVMGTQKARRKFFSSYEGDVVRRAVLPRMDNFINS